MRLVALALALTLALALAVALPAAPAQAQDVAPGRVLGVETAMTLGQARAALTDVEWSWELRFMVDFSALCAKRDGETLFCALAFEADAPRPDLAIEALMVESPALRTADGVHVGMPIAEAEAIWGDALFAFHTQNESREFVMFDKGPARIAARAALPGQDAFHVGRYAAPFGEYNETRDYPPDAVIGVLWVD